jgi:hypothetical protein
MSSKPPALPRRTAVPGEAAQPMGIGRRQLVTDPPGDQQHEERNAERRGSGLRLGSRQLFCIHMAKRRPATHEGLHLLVVGTSSDAEPRRRLPLSRMRDSRVGRLARASGSRGEAIALSRRLPTGMLAEFVNRPLFAWSRRASGSPRDDAAHVSGDRRRMPAPSQFRPWLDFKRLTTLGFPRRFRSFSSLTRRSSLPFSPARQPHTFMRSGEFSRTTWLNVKALRRFPRVDAGWTPGGGAAMPIA